MNKICIITTGHMSNDVRVFVRETRSLAKLDAEVFFVVTAEEECIKGGVHIIPLRQHSSRMDRFLKKTKEAYKKACEIDADIYHFHDPDFLPYAIKLRKAGKKVIYDAHENVPKQILLKEWIPTRFLRIGISKLFNQYETYCVNRLSAIIGAYDSITDRFVKVNNQRVTISNYPLLNELARKENGQFAPQKQIAYIGLISQIRGIEQVVKSLELVEDVKLILCGNFDSQATFEKVKNMPGWASVDYRGVVNREEVKDILNTSIAGIVTFLDTPHHRNAEPNKLFEYMSASIPVIASNFELWKPMVEEYDCGIMVDPSNPNEIAEAIKSLAENFALAEQKGKNGRKAINEKYNWESQEKKLFELYNNLM